MTGQEGVHHSSSTTHSTLFYNNLLISNSTYNETPSMEDRMTSPGEGSVSKGVVVISSSIAASLAVIAVIIGLICAVKYLKSKGKVKSRNRIRKVRSNTQLSFDNLSYVGEVDMTEFEVMRSKMVTSIKRKVSSAFSSAKDKPSANQGDTGPVSCGRLTIIETNYDNSNIDLGEIVQTFQV